ncbi:MAG: universal stress protein [Solirubrobacteraceae bacterium]
MPVTASNTIRSHTDTGPWKGARLAVGVNGHPEGRDAAALAATLACTSRPTPRSLRRAALVPHARMVVETDVSVARALERVARREHRGLLVIGSRRWGPIARVILGSTGETLLHGASCPILVVPRTPN